MKENEIFVPGRLCLFGEHSDWASEYKKENNKIIGSAIVTCLNIGIKAKVKENNSTFLLKENNKCFKISINDEQKMKDLIKSNDYYSYVSSVLLYMKNKYEIKGIEIDIISNTLPQKKGLSSSAAISVLVVRAFNRIYNLNLNKEEEMNIAYLCERKTKSKCGKMDQVVAFNDKTLLMNFEKGNMSYNTISVGDDIYLILADLKSSKNTPKILSDLNKALLKTNFNSEKDIVKYFEKDNNEIINKAIKYIEQGDTKKLGKLMTYAQKIFDETMIKYCPSELNSKKLHTILEDSVVKKYSYGGKGVGSQGDGSVQFVVKDEKSQLLLKKYLENQYNLDVYPIKIEKKEVLKKAIIPLAGNGTRMSPFTYSVPKSFIPIVKDNCFKPLVLILVEELLEAGIEEVYLVIEKNHKNLYDNLFINYKFKGKIKYIYQEKKLGLGDTLTYFDNYIRDEEKYLLVLGDQFYSSNSHYSCTKQLITQYNKNPKHIISVCKKNINSVEKYGVFFCEKNKKSELVKINDIIEKPKKEVVKKKIDKNTTFYIAFGEYILDRKIIKEIKRLKANKDFEKELPFTELLMKIYGKNLYAFVPNGKMYDFGNIEAYQEAMDDLY